MNLAPEPQAPRLATALTRPHQLFALVLGIGTIPFWPGTFGTLAGFGLFALLHQFPVEARAGAYLVLLVAGSWAIAKAGRDLGSADHNSIVFDEAIAMSLVLEFIAPGPFSWMAAFLLFRLFDVTKPWPIHLVHRTGAGGFMVILDDLLAGLYAVLLVRYVLAPLLG